MALNFESVVSGMFPAYVMMRSHMQIKFEVFRGTFSSWDTLFTQAAEFANSLVADRLINISHSADNSDGVVVVWYWD